MTEEWPRFFPFEPENAHKMAAYMKNHFPFLGVSAPERKKLEAPWLKESKQWEWPRLCSAIQFYFHQPEREYQYFAIDLAQGNYQRLTIEQLHELLPLVGEKTWWDSIDAWRKVYSDWCYAHPANLPEVFGWFYGQEDFWLRRVGINLQLKFKEQTDTDLLQKALDADRTTPEFFIQKAIGWSLREYSKTNPEWVQAFCASQPPLSSLALREGGKYLPK